MSVYCFLFFVLFFFKQKTAYEMRISDWSSDVCSSDLGYTFLEIFESHPGAKPCYSNPRHQRYFEEVHGEVYAGVFGYLNSKKDAQNAPTPRKPAEIIKFDEPDDTWVKTGGLWTKCVFVGPENCPDSPVGIAIKADGGVADYVAGKRSFGTTTMTVVLRGNVMHDGRWMSQGDMYMSPPDELNGDLVFGPDGSSEENTSELQSLMRSSYAV